MGRVRNVSVYMAAAVAFCMPGAAQHATTADLLDRAQDAVITYVQELADVHCTEDVQQVKVKPDGKAEASLKTQYDYFVLLQGNSGDFQISESRLETSKEPQHQAPLLLSNGFSMLLLIFHPYYRSGFAFTLEGQEQRKGRNVMRYHFAHLAGARTPAALALRQREYPLDLQGSAWLDAESGQPLRIDAELLHPMTDIGLRSLAIHVEYEPVASIPGNPVLATAAEVDLETPRQHWRNSHVFRNYKLFSADATQDPNVKVHAGADETQDDPGQASTREKP